jgi:hypothetical protein
MPPPATWQTFEAPQPQLITVMVHDSLARTPGHDKKTSSSHKQVTITDQASKHKLAVSSAHKTKHSATMTVFDDLPAEEEEAMLSMDEVKHHSNKTHTKKSHMSEDDPAPSAHKLKPSAGNTGSNNTSVEGEEPASIQDALEDSSVDNVETTTSKADFTQHIYKSSSLTPVRLRPQSPHPPPISNSQWATPAPLPLHASHTPPQPPLHHHKTQSILAKHTSIRVLNSRHRY